MNEFMFSVMPRRFVIIAAPRTGSNWLCTLLNSHPRILCHHELFNPEGIHYALDQGKTLISTDIITRDRDPRAFLEHFWQYQGDVDALGFKLNRGQTEAIFEMILEDLQIAKILLRRRNRVKTYVSEQIAQMTGRWESYTYDFQPTTISKIAVDVADLKRHIDENETYFQGLRAQIGSAPCFELFYEDIPSIQSCLLAFLGITSSEHLLRAGTLKQNPCDLSDLIANFDELERVLPPPLRAELRAKGF